MAGPIPETPPEVPGERQAPLRRVVYASRAAPDTGVEALADLLQAARARNAAAGITGLLVTFEDRFLQCLEGPESAIRDVMASIRRDPRHARVQTLMDEPAEARLFASWSMGALATESLGWLRLLHADWSSETATAPGNPGAPTGLSVLRKLADHFNAAGQADNTSIAAFENGPQGPKGGAGRGKRPLLNVLDSVYVVSLLLLGLVLLLLKVFVAR